MIRGHVRAASFNYKELRGELNTTHVWCCLFGNGAKWSVRSAVTESNGPERLGSRRTLSLAVPAGATATPSHSLGAFTNLTASFT